MAKVLSNKGKLNDNKISFSSICIAVILLCAALTGFVPQTILSVIVLVACVLLVNTEAVYLLFPIMLFYYERFGTIAGMSVYRYFSFFFIAVAILHANAIKIKKLHFAPLIIFIIYAFIVVAPHNLRRAIFAVVDIFCVVVLISHYLSDFEKTKNFFKVYAIVSIIAFFTGLFFPHTMTGEQIVNGEFVTVVRYIGTFEDPNYAGFFYTIAIFAMVTLELFSKKVRIAFIILIYIFILLTSSITAIVVNAVLWLIYLITTRRMNLKTVIVLCLVAALLVAAYLYGIENPDAPVVGSISVRISGKLEAIVSGDYNELTTNRTNLTYKHWEYFKGQSVFKMLVGLNPASTFLTNILGMSGAAHNEFVDLLLNVGIIGTAVMVGCIIIQLSSSYKRYKQGDVNYYFIYIVKWIWVLYAMTLTMYGDYRFMLFFLL